MKSILKTDSIEKVWNGFLELSEHSDIIKHLVETCEKGEILSYEHTSHKPAEIRLSLPYL